LFLTCRKCDKGEKRDEKITHDSKNYDGPFRSK
jgi:hypothetical protein